MFLRVVVSLLVLGATLLGVSAQVERVLPRKGASSLEGTSFVVGFMANEILEASTDPRIQIFISSKYDARVTIRSSITGTYTVFVPANTVRKEDVHAIHVVNASERAFDRAVFIESDVPIVVYALNTIAQSSDSYTAIPIRHLGQQYFTVNRPTDWYDSRRSSNIYTRTPRVGEFMIIAVENNTWVDISTATETKNRVPARTPWRILLQKGECYLVQALGTRHGGDDLTGSYISSSAPIAVLSGHQRTSVPCDSTLSKDHLVEQLPSIDKWGVAYATSAFYGTTRNDVFRIMGSRANQQVTLVTRGGTRVFYLTSPGDWVDVELREPASWSSDDRFLVTQFMSSNSGSNINSDPAMVVVPAIEHFVRSALFQFPQLEVTGRPSQRFYYFLNIVCNAAALNSLRIGGNLVTDASPTIRNQIIPGTSLHWTTVQMSQGSHIISADSGLFSGTMYGTSEVDSYANIYGISYDPIEEEDDTPPAYNLLVDCGTISGSVYDYSIKQPLLKEVSVQQPRTFNYRWYLSDVKDEEGRREIEAEVRDLWKDAQIVFNAWDNQGNGREWLYTYDAPNVQVPQSIFISVDGNERICTTVVIRNIDSTPVKIMGVVLTGDTRLRVQGVARDSILAPGDSMAIEICFTPTKDTTNAIGSLVFEYPCKLIQMVSIQTRGFASIQTEPLDLGDVRLGDTACGRIPISNQGTVDITITAIDVAAVTAGFTVDITRLGLPRLLRPRDTLWLDVCFTPEREGPVERSDVVQSSPAQGLLAKMKARGVRPRILPIVVDWGKRHIGTRNDTAVTIRNSGTSATTLWIDSSALVGYDFADLGSSMKSVSLAPNDSLVVSLRYLPTRRGLQATEAKMDVDWRGHDSIGITLIGIGTMPDINVANIDMGSIEVATTKDSIVDLVQTGFSGGNSDLAVYSVTISGPDVASFVLPPTLLELTTLTEGSTLRNNIQFRPSRVGTHQCTVTIECNAAPMGERSIASFLVQGTSFERATAVVGLTLLVDAKATVCTSVPVRVNLANSGNGPARIDTLQLDVDGQTLHLAVPTPIHLPAFESVTIDTAVMFNRASDSRLFVRAVDSIGGVYSARASVRLEVPETVADIRVATPPPYNVGPATLRLNFQQLTSQDASADVSFTCDLPSTRFQVDPRWVAKAEVEELPFAPRMISIGVAIQGDKLHGNLGPLRGAWKATIEVPGSFLWANPETFSLRASLDETQCSQQSPLSEQVLGVSPCGPSQRVVSFGNRAIAAAKPLAQPARDVVSIEIEASTEMDVQVLAEPLRGQRFIVNERISLQKGLQHCNFSCSGWASGVYRLIFRHNTGMTECQIIIVN